MAQILKPSVASLEASSANRYTERTLAMDDAEKLGAYAALESGAVKVKTDIKRAEKKWVAKRGEETRARRR